jgi:hypothetical protein
LHVRGYQFASGSIAENSVVVIKKVSSKIEPVRFIIVACCIFTRYCGHGRSAFIKSEKALINKLYSPHAGGIFDRERIQRSNRLIFANAKLLK